MVESNTVRYHGERCDHTISIEFVGRDSWQTKEIGCNQCGRTGLFKRIDDEDNDMITHDDSSDLKPTQDSDVKPEEQDDEQQQDTDPVEETETDTQESGEDTVAEFEDDSPQGQDDESVEDNMDFDSTKPVGHALPEDYRDLQGVAGQFDIKKNQKKEELYNQIVAQYDDDPEKYAEIVCEDGE